MAKLYTELKVKDLILKNRMVMAPMCMYQATEDGYPTTFHTIHYVNRAIGGVGLMIFEATAVESRGRISGHDLGLWEDGQIEPTRKLVEEIKKYGSKVGVQLAHAGRKCGVDTEEIISCSPLQFSDHYKKPNEMTKDDIKVVVKAFKDATRRALDCGFDTIELHAAHGYLINQFLSPLTNERTDEYGGSIENRSRFLKEVIIAVRESWPKEKPLMIRVSAEDFKEGGNQTVDLVKIINLVKDQGVDMVDVSTGGVVKDAIINPYPGYQVKYAEKIQNETGLITVAGGLITNSEMVEEIVANNRSELVFLGRLLLREPYFPLQAADDLQVELEWPYFYKRGRK